MGWHARGGLMPNKQGHRRFGSLRKLPSGRWQARFPGPDGLMRTAPETFARRAKAERYLTLVEAQLARHEWIDPDRAKILLRDYAERWIAHRPRLRPRTVHLYTWLLGKYVTPNLGGVQLGRLDTAMVREWRARLIESGVSETMAAKAYRLLRAVLVTAVKEGELIRTNPCRIPGADRESPAERPVLTVGELLALVAEMPDRYRAFVLLTTFASLRWGEAIALQRRDVDLDGRAIHVRQAFVEVRGRGFVLGPPKSRAGRRVVALPQAVVPALRHHLAEYAGEEPDSFVFTGPTGATIWRGNFNKLVGWKAATTKIGQPNLHLRHTGNTLASRTGASLRDLMTRMGHDSPRAALIYQHASREADRAIAKAVDVAIRQARKRTRRNTRRADDNGSLDVPHGDA
jgi:integrase